MMPMAVTTLLCLATTSVERWSLFELTLKGPSDDGTSAPFSLALSATFRQEVPGNETITVGGFFDGGNLYRVRFSPPREGRWSYVTASESALLDGHTGSLTVTPAGPGNHGPVESRGFGFVHADGTPYFSVGTTSYQWASMPLSQQQQTLETLRGSPFNKMRMTVFPKWYVYNHANPVEVGTAYEIKPGSLAANASAWECVGAQCPSLAGSFDLRRFNVSFWRNYEQLLREMQRSGVIADIIVFHPYDDGHWGFDCMGGREAANYSTSHDKVYLRYLAARLAGFSNVWWSMANEWNFCTCKGRGVNESLPGGAQSPSPVWDELFKTLAAADPYHRQMSIHNGRLLYNHSRPWISHVSIQGLEAQTARLRATYAKPLIWDEVQYEGNLPCCPWGALSAEEESDRFWWGASLGVYVGHSETLLRPNVQDDAQPLWWAKGGRLIGRSPERIQWMRGVWTAVLAAAGEFGTLVPSNESFGMPTLVANTLSDVHGRFRFLRFLRQGRWVVPLSGRGPTKGASGGGDGWRVAQLDFWAMSWSNRTLPAGDDATIECSTLPCNVMLFQGV